MNQQEKTEHFLEEEPWQEILSLVSQRKNGTFSTGRAYAGELVSGEPKREKKGNTFHGVPFLGTGNVGSDHGRRPRHTCTTARG